ncbi:DUF814 domain-containing protein [Desulfovibrionales bacterium]
MPTYHALALFSGGLDSILASTLMQSLGQQVLGIHFISPFFGHPERVHAWEQEYSLPIMPVDIGQEFVDMMSAFPPHGFGKVLNPCVDCKILMLRQAKKLLPDFGASYIISGEVLGQRPMSQRADTLHIIRNKAQVRDVLLRPLSAGLLPPTPMEESGLVNRSALLSISGRGRTQQYALAQSLGITTIPAQAGGCRLGERESVRRYWPIFQAICEPRVDNFDLANVGRQLWHRHNNLPLHWLVIGRDNADNERLLPLARPDDYIFMLADFPGPLALARPTRDAWPIALVQEAASCVVSFAPKARKAGGPVRVIVRHNNKEWPLWVPPPFAHNFAEPPAWSQTRECIRAKTKELSQAVCSKTCIETDTQE